MCWIRALTLGYHINLYINVVNTYWLWCRPECKLSELLETWEPYSAGWCKRHTSGGLLVTVFTIHLYFILSLFWCHYNCIIMILCIIHNSQQLSLIGKIIHCSVDYWKSEIILRIIINYYIETLVKCYIYKPLFSCLLTLLKDNF